MLTELIGRVTERRRHIRYCSPVLKLRIDGHTLKTIDWSLGGLRVFAPKVELPAGGRWPAELVLPNGLSGEIVIESVHRGDDGATGMRFIEIDSRLLIALSNLPPAH